MEENKQGLGDVQEDQGEIDTLTLDKRIEEAEQAERSERREIEDEW